MAEDWRNKDKPKFTIENDIIIGDYDPKFIKECSLAKITLDTLKNYPDVIGRIHAETNEKLTFAEMKDRSVRCAVWLRKQNLSKDDIVAITTFNQINDFVPIFACIFDGIVGSPWSNELTEAEARYYFEVVNPKILFACEKTIDMLWQVATDMKVNCKLVVIGQHQKFPSLMKILAEQSQEEVDNFSYYEPANPTGELGFLFFSSGTTGKPKGTMRTLESLLNNHSHYDYDYEHSIHLEYSNISWATAVEAVLTAVRFKSTRIIHETFDPEETCKVIQKFKVNMLFVSPTKIANMWAANVFDRYTLPSFEVLTFGGAKVNKTIVEKVRKSLPNVLVLNGYGMTESGLISLQTAHCKGTDSVGYVVEHATVKIIDTETGRTLGSNQEGEICVQSYNKMLGYYKNPQATKEMIDEEDWVHTGDLGYYDENGELYVTNRLKEVIITKNRKIAPSKIEEILTEHPGVADVAVVAVPNIVDGERPLAFVVRKSGSTVAAEELKELPKSYNPFYELTGGVIFLEEFPQTTTGKKNFKQLKIMAQSYAL